MIKFEIDSEHHIQQLECAGGPGALSHVRLVSEYGQAGEPLLRVELT